ncbi:hypothetical protein ACFL13_02130 [Patescibacteria group bacterium]
MKKVFLVVAFAILFALLFAPPTQAAIDPVKFDILKDQIMVGNKFYMSVAWNTLGNSASRVNLTIHVPGGLATDYSGSCLAGDGCTINTSLKNYRGAGTGTSLKTWGKNPGTYTVVVDWQEVGGKERGGILEDSIAILPLPSSITNILIVGPNKLGEGFSYEYGFSTVGVAQGVAVEWQVWLGDPNIYPGDSNEDDWVLSDFFVPAEFVGQEHTLNARARVVGEESWSMVFSKTIQVIENPFTFEASVPKNPVVGQEIVVEITDTTMPSGSCSTEYRVRARPKKGEYFPWVFGNKFTPTSPGKWIVELEATCHDLNYSGVWAAWTAIDTEWVSVKKIQK